MVPDEFGNYHLDNGSIIHHSSVKNQYFLWHMTHRIKGPQFPVNKGHIIFLKADLHYFHTAELAKEHLDNHIAKDKCVPVLGDGEELYEEPV